MTLDEQKALDGFKLVYARYIRKNGKKIYPKNGKMFRFWVKPKEEPVKEQQERA